MVENPTEEGRGPAQETSRQGTSFPTQVLEMESEFTVLSHPRCRYLLYTLAEKPSWNLRELATKIAAWELDLPEEAVPETDRDIVYVSLIHAHVPKLVDHDAAVFEKEDEVLRKSEFTDQILKYWMGLVGVPIANNRGMRGENLMSKQGDTTPGTQSDTTQQLTDSQAHYEHEDHQDLTTTIILAVADAEGVEPTEIKSPPLYDHIDAPAVEEALFGPKRKRNTDVGRQSINFFYRGHDITVRSDGWVFVDTQSG